MNAGNAALDGARAPGSGTRVCVFCGARPGSDPAHRTAAQQLGKALAAHRLELIYGGSALGLMGEVANAALEHGGRVQGVIPKFLMASETAHPGLSDLLVVDSLEERKTIMLRRADAFIGLPGGFGTLDEVFEVLCQAQLGLHAKPCWLINVGGFFDRLIEFLDHCTAQGFVSAAHRSLVRVAPSSDAAMAEFIDSRAVRARP